MPLLPNSSLVTQAESWHKTNVFEVMRDVCRESDTCLDGPLIQTAMVNPTCNPAHRHWARDAHAARKSSDNRKIFKKKNELQDILSPEYINRQRENAQLRKKKKKDSKAHFPPLFLLTFQPISVT